MAGRAVIVDLPHGHRDDPPGRAGLAALIARLLADPDGTHAVTAAATCPGCHARDRGWVTRHQLEEHCSSFAFWSAADDDLEAAADGFAHPAGPDASRLRHAVDAQTRLAEAHARDPYQRYLETQDLAAWGAVAHPLGTAESLAAIEPDEIHAAIRAAVAQGPTTYHEDGHTPAGSVAPPGARWSGGVRTRWMPGEATRVAVAAPLTEPAPGAASLLVEVLGSNTFGGRLSGALRADGQAAYGLGARLLSRAGAVAVAVQAQVPAAGAATAARRLAAVLRHSLAEPIPPTELVAAARRARTALLLQADQPFGRADEARRSALGLPTPARTAADIGRRASDGQLPVPLPGSPWAAVAVGAVTDGLADVLTEVCR